MQLTGFDLADYERLLDVALANGWQFVTVEEYLRDDDLEEPFVVLRHDVDRKVGSAVAMANAEADRDVQSTYYFRTSKFDSETARAMSEQGHEIGYHYEDLAKTHGDVAAAYDRFERNLERFRKHVDVTTACAHGSPLSPHNNTDMWSDDPNFDEYDLLGEAYLSINFDNDRPAGLYYLSDTSRDWNLDLPGFGLIRNTDDVVDALRARARSRLYMLAHPCRWSKSRVEFLERSGWDVTTETVKSLVERAHRIQRA
ncbi:hypothetical protein [Halorussus salinisoli]|uniref:hypothetical protein n=1 Tax=Halorussus salinisoli TaxID=2558242 RepID=UPI002A91F73F|nr:hypothetical protein [Halorussus salinisoli]